jgi:hypothetical protein
MKNSQLTTLSFQLFLIIALAFFTLTDCKQAPKTNNGGEITEEQTVNTALLSVEDTVRNQTGGKLYYLTINPTDSITVIYTDSYKLEGGTFEGMLYREYHFIVHNRHSNGHRKFETSTLDSTYNSYKNKQGYNYSDEILRHLKSMPTKHIDTGIKKFNGYWVELKEYNGNYYLNDSWEFQPSFCIADGLLIHFYMDGPYPQKIQEAVSLPENGISLSILRNDTVYTFDIKTVDREKQVYRLNDGRFITPASAIHNFEIIQYTNTTGDLIS